MEKIIEYLKNNKSEISSILEGQNVYVFNETELIDLIKQCAINGVGSNEVALRDNKVTRFEVIDKTGRGYVNYNVHRITKSLQDNDRTLKIIIE